MVQENEKLKKKLKQLEKELTTQKKLNFSEMITKNETNSNIKNRYLNLTAPQKVNLNNRFSMCCTENNMENINNLKYNELGEHNTSTQNIQINRTQIALSNMEKELSFLKKYLFPEQNQNIDNNNYMYNNYLENYSFPSNNIYKNLMNTSNYTINKDINSNFIEKNYSNNLKLISQNNSISFCKVENFSLNRKKDGILKDNAKLKELEKENMKLKNELNLIKKSNNKENINYINQQLELDESLSFDENNIKSDNINDTISKKSNYFFNKGRKVLLSKCSKIHFIKKISDEIKNMSKNNVKSEKEDTKILIQLNQTIKNLNQNIISDMSDKQRKQERDKNNFLKKKTNKNF